MSLTTDDLKQIKTIVTDIVTGVVTDATSGLATKVELEAATAKLATKKDLDRLESRVVTAMGLMERDAFSRLEDHELRIAKLELAAGSSHTP